MCGNFASSNFAFLVVDAAVANDLFVAVSNFATVIFFLGVVFLRIVSVAFFLGGDLRGDDFGSDNPHSSSSSSSSFSFEFGSGTSGSFIPIPKVVNFLFLKNDIC